MNQLIWISDVDDSCVIVLVKAADNDVFHDTEIVRVSCFIESRWYWDGLWFISYNRLAVVSSETSLSYQRSKLALSSCQFVIPFDVYFKK